LEFVEKYLENGLELVKIYSKTKSSYFTVAPERGAIVVLLNLSGKEILYLNEATLFDRTKNIRGGIPVLFPICGRVVDGKIFFKGQEFEMKNHGFARDSSFNIVVWSLKDFDFVCVEPWMGEHEGYINNKFYYLEPGAIFEGWFAIKLANE